MSRIRPLEREDVPAVASLYELVERSGTPDPPPGLAAYLERVLFDQPFFDPELPSLVFDEPDEGIVGFIASHPRRFVYGARVVRMAGSAHFVTHPNVRSRGVGALLMRSYLAGPQDFATPDPATDTVHAMWEGLGGVTDPMASVGWLRILAPSTFLTGALARRRGWKRTPGERAWMTFDGISAGSLRPSAPTATFSEPLTPEVMLDGLSEFRRAFAMQPHYDTPSLTWLFGEMEAASVVHGPLVRRAVRRPDGKLVGWYVSYLPSGHNAEMLQVAGSGDDIGLVLDDLFHEAAERGATAIRGRVDAYLYPHLRQRRCLFRGTSWSLVHSRDPTLIGTILSGRALVTRLEGEWWMALHSFDAETLAGLAESTTPVA